MKNQDIAMQTRCVFCGQEQYAPAVSAISIGQHPCVWCGKMSQPMTQQEYDELINKLRQQHKT